jgi:Mn2+/Fe2+ NRAMP family transporter
MKLLMIVLLSAVAVGCGYGSNYNSMNGTVTPAISSLNPMSTSAGSAAFTLTINGTGFTAGSIVWWGTTQMPASSTGYGSSTQLTVSITAAMVANPGTVSVYVHTNAGNSNMVNFTIK